MVKALIVDDERMIRNGICSMIPWERLGIDSVSMAGSGTEALEAIQREQPDILLTDICMDEMDGLTLIERVNELNPEIRIIVLTGYDNFEYVQKCCRMQVQDFLLKPAGEDELAAAIRKQVGELNRIRELQHRQRTISRVQGLAEQMRLEEVMRRLVKERVPPEELAAFCAEFRYRLDQPMQAALILPMLHDGGRWKEHGDLLGMSVKKLCAERFDSNMQGITFEDDEGRIVLSIFVDGTFDEPVERIGLLKELLEDEFNVCPQAVMGSVVTGFTMFSVSYNDACSLLNDEKVGTGNIVQPKILERRLQMFADTFLELRKTMVANVSDAGNLLKGFDTFVKSTQSYNISHSLVRRYCFDVASALYYARVAGGGLTADNRLVSLMSALQSGTGEDACRITRDFIIQLTVQDEGNTHELVLTAKQYIQDHLGEDISVSSIAGTLFVTPNYFSRLFKRVCGEGCNEYIVRERIERAKNLLTTTSMKTGRIAGIVGYRDTNYFSLAFKKHTGMSPTEYRESARTEA